MAVALPPAARRASRPARVEHRDADAGQQEQREHQRVAGRQAGQPGADPGQADAERSQPRQPVPVGEDTHQDWGSALPSVAASARPDAPT